MSQYHHPLYFAQLAHPTVQARIASDLQHFFDTTLKARIPLLCYAMDLAWFGDASDVGEDAAPARCMLVEVNPLDGFLGTQQGSMCLFDWTAPADHAIGTLVRASVRLCGCVASHIHSLLLLALCYRYDCLLYTSPSPRDRG